MNINEINTFIIAAESGNLEQVKQAIEDGMPIDSPNEYEETALQKASITGQTDVVEYLLLKGADPNKQTYNGNTPVIFAASYGFKDIVELLLQYGADKDIKGDRGTATEWAEREGYLDVVDVLENPDLSFRLNNIDMGWSKTSDNEIDHNYTENQNSRHITDAFNFLKQERTRLVTIIKTKQVAITVTHFKDIHLPQLQEAFNELVANDGKPKPDSIPNRVMRVISKRKKKP